MHKSILFLVAVATVGLSFGSASAQVGVTYSCNGTPTGSVEWPENDPIWTFDFVRPRNSSGDDGSSLELRDVYYNGNLVLKRAHTPVLNVEYEAGGCGCFRDWADSESQMEADGVQSGSCVALSTPGTVRTTCDTGVGGIPGSFTGVAFEEYPGELVATSHMSAGWYKYRIKWHFYDDGRIWPEYSFAASSATCTSADHRHHVYWRFDFDMDGASDDYITEVNPTTETELNFTTEEARTWGNGTDGIYWRVRDEVTGSGYRVVPSAADLLLPIDGFSKTDAIVARYDGTVDDAGGGCAINYSNIVNGGDVANEDVVLWYRSGALHTGGNPFECDIVGPTLIPDNASTTAVEETDLSIPEGFVLESAYPNPFNPTTTVRFTVAESQNVTMTLVDALGRHVADLHRGYAEAGRSESIRIDGSNLPSGTYTVRLEGESILGTTRVVLIK